MSLRGRDFEESRACWAILAERRGNDLATWCTDGVIVILGRVVAAILGDKRMHVIERKIEIEIKSKMRARRSEQSPRLRLFWMTQVIPN